MLSIRKSRSAEYYMDLGHDHAPVQNPDFVFQSVRPYWWTAARQDGAIIRYHQDVAAEEFSLLCSGVNPRTRASLVRRTRLGRVQLDDFTFNCPKAVSIAWMLGNSDQRRQIQVIACEAAESALDFVHQEQLVVVRRDAAGRTRQCPVEYCSALFVHSTNRKGDPHIHIHAAHPNWGRTQDGHSGALDIRLVFRWAHAIDAIFLGKLADGLGGQLGIVVNRSRGTLELRGVPRVLVREFSRRRRAIEAAASMKGYETATNRRRAQIDNLITRPRKSTLPPAEELEREWNATVTRCGFVRAALWRSITFASPYDRQAAPQDESARLARIYRSIKAGMVKQPFITRQEVIVRALAAPIGRTSTDEALGAVDVLIRHGALTLIRYGQDTCYTTGELLRLQAQILDLARHRESDLSLSAPWIKDMLCRQSVPALESDRVAYALGQKFVTVVECAEGRTCDNLISMIDWIAECADHHAVSWTATADGIEARNRTAQYAATANDVAAAAADNKPTKTLHIIDGAAKISLQALGNFLAVNCDGIAKLVLIDAPSSMAPGENWNVFRLLGSHVGTNNTAFAARRQSGWMKAASMDAGQMNAMTAIEAYERRGFVEWANDRSSACTQLVAAYTDDVLTAKTSRRGLVLVPDSSTANDLNERLRKVYRNAGMLGVDEVRLATAHRANPAKTRQITLAVGDRVRVWPDNGAPRKPAAAKLGVVTAVATASNNGVTHVEVRTDSGNNVPIRNAFYVDYGYAMPWTAPESRKTWCDGAWVLATQSFGPGEAAVCLTRHRQSLRIFVDTEGLTGAAYRAAPNSETAPNPSRSVIAMARGKLADAVGDAARVGQLCLVEPPIEQAQPTGFVTALRARMSARLHGAQYPVPRVDVEFFNYWETRLRRVFGDAIGKIAAWRQRLEDQRSRRPISTVSTNTSASAPPSPDTAAPATDGMIDPSFGP